MDVRSDVVTDECVEVLVQTRGEDPSLGQEAESLVDNSAKPMSSFEKLVRTAMALEEDPRDEHSYAFTEKRQAFEGKEKDHCYSTSSKLSHRAKLQSLSDENLYRSSELLSDTEFLNDPRLVLPHYSSKDSALDVTGFDSISEKCLSYDNLNVKTVDVVTHQCILPGFSDPDISKMTLKNDESVDKPSSLPSSPPSDERQLNIEHNYFKHVGKNSSSDHSYMYDRSMITAIPTCHFSTGFSDQDFSKMALKNSDKIDMSASGASRSRKNNSILSTRSTSSQVGVNEKSTSFSKVPETIKIQFKSPLYDHSYGTSQKRHSLIGNPSLKRGRSSEKVDESDGYQSFKTQDLMKSPFLDHSYQSCRLQNVGKRQNIGKKVLPTSICDQSKDRIQDKATLNSLAQKLDFKESLHIPKPLFHDHPYGQMYNLRFGDVGLRSRSYSLSETSKSGNAFLKTDHCYTVSNSMFCFNEDNSNGAVLSDSGTESLNEDEEEAMSVISDSVDTLRDHSYVTAVR